MAEDWAIDVRKYAPDADDTIIASIVRHCGIALRNRDSSLVSFSDPAETARVRDGYCRKKLGLTGSDAEIDAVIARIGEQMRGDTTKNRVTVYYLLAEAFEKLGLFGAAAAVAAAAAPAAAAEVPPAPAAPAAPAAAPAIAVAAAVPITAAMPAAAPLYATSAPARTRDDDDDKGGGFGRIIALSVGGLAAIILGTAIIGSLSRGHVDRNPPVIPPQTPEQLAALTAAAPVAAAAIPAGSGVTATEVAGKPQVSVYFDTARTDIAPDFATVAAPVKAWVDGHPGVRLAVSGFNDPRGNAAFNAELSKNRAKSVAAALAALGVPAAAIDLEKPPETTDTETSQSQARRVDIVVKEPN